MAELRRRRVGEIRGSNGQFPKATEKRLQELLSAADWSDAMEYSEEVFCASGRIVNVVTKTCSCGEYWDFKFPCTHVAAVCVLKQLPIAEFVDETYYRSSVLAVYNVPTIPIDIEDLALDGLTLPLVKRPSNDGRRRRRLPSRGELEPDGGDDGGRRCRVCRRPGHNSATCSQAMAAPDPAAEVGPSSPLVVNNERPVRRAKECPRCRQRHYKHFSCNRPPATP